MKGSRTAAGLIAASLTVTVLAGCGGTSAPAGAAPATAQPAATASGKAGRSGTKDAGRIAEGVLVALTGTQVTVRTTAGDRTYPTAAQVTVRVDGTLSSVGALKPGMRVSLYDSAHTGRGTASPAAVASPDGPVARITARSAKASASQSAG